MGQKEGKVRLVQESLQLQITENPTPVASTYRALFFSLCQNLIHDTSHWALGTRASLPAVRLAPLRVFSKVTEGHSAPDRDN